MGDKMFETLPSNLGNLGEQNNSKPSHLPYIQSWGVCCFLRTGRTQVLRTGRSEAQQCLEGVGEGKLFSFLSRQNVRKVLWGKKKALHLSVNVFSTKVLTGDTIFTSPTGDGTSIFRGHPTHAKVKPIAVQREYLHFSVILRPSVMVRPLRESNPRPPALQSSALPAELILLRLLKVSQLILSPTVV